MLNERTYHTPDSCLTHLFPRSRVVVAYTVVHLVTPDCTRGVIDPLYYSRHNDRDRQYECDRGIMVVSYLYHVVIFCRYYCHTQKLLLPNNPEKNAQNASTTRRTVNSFAFHTFANVRDFLLYKLRQKKKKFSAWILDVRRVGVHPL